VKNKFAALGEAAAVLGTPHVRNLATLGGNLCNASPAAECAPPLLVLNAAAKIWGLRRERVVPMDAFFTGPGRSVVERDEMLTEIRIPIPPTGSAGVHLKYGSRRVDVAVVGVSVLLAFDGQQCRDALIALGAVGPTPFRARSAEDMLKGATLDELSGELIKEVSRAASAESRPIDDLRARGSDRRSIVEILVREGISSLISRQRRAAFVS